MSHWVGGFYLSGMFEPEEITHQIGISPSWSYRVGDPGDGGPRTGAVWGLACNEDSSGDAADQVIDIVVALREKAEVVSSLAEQFNGTLQVVSTHEEFFLGATIIRDLAKLNIHFRCVNAHQQDALL